jgi:serine/threonine protein kinase
VTGTLAHGQVLRDRYRIVQLVGAGGGGAVYRADDMRLAGRVTAVKEIRADPDAGPELMTDIQAQFRFEAQTLARLDHPALPKVSDYFEIDGTDYLVMDFVSGPDLRQVVTEARAAGSFLDERRVVDWSLQLLDALAYLHGQSPAVLHRDIKPANIKLVEGGRIKLVDFGLVKPLDPSDPRTLTVARGVGSLPYTPLEQYAGDTGHTDPRSDLYALGATMYHLLTGSTPATAQERFLMPAALVRPRKLNPQVSPHVEDLVLAAMALHPDRRPSSAEEMTVALRNRVPVGRPERESTSGNPLLAWRPFLSQNGGLLVLVAFLLLLATLATWESQRQGSEGPGSAVGTATVVSPAGGASAP